MLGMVCITHQNITSPCSAQASNVKDEFTLHVAE